MYSDTKFNWFDQSQIETKQAETTVDNTPLFATVISSDKGTEDVVRIKGLNFYKMFGRQLSFEKHGQPLIQAARIIDAGGELLVKRLVAEDATLSNLVLIANVEETRVQNKNEEGELLYIDPSTGEETTVAANPETSDPYNPSYTVSGGIVKWEAVSVSACSNIGQVKEEAEKLFKPEEGKFPMLIVTDVGRNKDCKAIRIMPDYDVSRSTNVMFYRAYEYESTSSEDNATITMNPAVTYNGKAYSINQDTMSQLKMDTIDGVFDAYVEDLAAIAGISVEEMANLDVINCKNRKGVAIPGLTVSEDSVNLAASFGVPLANGSDGEELGDKPIESPKYAEYGCKFFRGEYDEQVWDKDVNKIHAIVDANYPDAIKEEIANFVNFREDCTFFEDLGLGLTTFDAIYNKKNQLPKSKFVIPYMTSYKVVDPYSSKRIDVTMMYSLAPILVSHFASKPAYPLAGEANNFVIYDAIPGTVNYIPRITPKVNQKELLEEARINYATYTETDGPLVVSSLYTSYEDNSQLSYANNVLAIQQVMRTLRTECPKNRFKFTTQNDFSIYSEACEEVLSAYRDNFETLNFVYLEDSIKESQKIYYAAIEFSFNNWTQAEIFDLYALRNKVDTETEE